MPQERTGANASREEPSSTPSRLTCCVRQVAAPSTFACGYLGQGSGCGFHSASADEHAEVAARCDLCESRRAEHGPRQEEDRSKSVRVGTGCYDQIHENRLHAPDPIKTGHARTSDDEYQALARAASARFCQRQRQAKERWAFDQRQRWFFDAVTRSCRFFDPDSPRFILAHAEIAGTYSRESSTWAWAWANESIRPMAGDRLSSVRRFGEVRRISQLTQGVLRTDEASAWDLTQIAACLLNVEAIYSALVNDHLRLFLLLGPFREQD